MEEFRSVLEYEGYYEISNLGNVRSVTRTIFDCNGREITYKSKMRVPFKDHRGYLRVPLCRDNKMQNKAVHRMIAEAFIPNPHNLPVVNHKDMNPLNNSIDNLEWCTQLYNMQEAFRIKGHEWVSKRPKIAGPRNKFNLKSKFTIKRK